LAQAKEFIATMHGKYRFPTLLKEVDRLCRETEEIKCEYELSLSPHSHIHQK